MNTHNNAAFNFFSSCARVVTPGDLQSSLQILFAPISRDQNVVANCRSTLSPQELHQAEQICFDNDKNQFIVRRAFRRYCGAIVSSDNLSLSEVSFQETEAGQPYFSRLPDVSFSFSASSGGYIACWSRRYKVGIDLEDVTRAVEPAVLAENYFSRTEAESIKRAKRQAQPMRFFQFWTLKEAALKSVGKGLPYGLDAFSFSLEPSARTLSAPVEFGDPKSFQARQLSGIDGCGALVFH